MPLNKVWSRRRGAPTGSEERPKMPANGQSEQNINNPEAGGKARIEGPITIKKYANRRLYNTASSSYVTLDHLNEMVKEGQDFVVYDAKTGEDITRSVLTQIIFEMEGKGQNMLPIRFLRQLIRYYGDSIQALVPGYLDMSMETFVRNQEAFRTQLTQALTGGANPFKGFEEQVRHNMALFERTMRMFSPFGTIGINNEAERAGAAPQQPARDEEIDALKSRLENMQRQLDTLSEKK
jgi:polyhydroxyalkanoate synthesis repressor PhaR